MWRNRRIAIAVPALLALLLGAAASSGPAFAGKERRTFSTAVAAAAAHGGGNAVSAESAAHAGDHVLRLDARTTNFMFVDVGKRDFSPGDTFVEFEEVVEDGRSVGALQITCTVGFRFSLNCDGGFLLYGRGKLTASGFIGGIGADRGVFYLPVVGGTGEFKGASGQVKVEFPTENTERYTFHYTTG